MYLLQKPHETYKKEENEKKQTGRRSIWDAFTINGNDRMRFCTSYCLRIMHKGTCCLWTHFIKNLKKFYWNCFAEGNRPHNFPHYSEILWNAKVNRLRDVTPTYKRPAHILCENIMSLLPTFPHDLLNVPDPQNFYHTLQVLKPMAEFYNRTWRQKVKQKAPLISKHAKENTIQELRVGNQWPQFRKILINYQFICCRSEHYFSPLTRNYFNPRVSTNR